MADPIIRILVEEAAPGGQPAKPGATAGHGAPAPSPRQGGGEEDDFAARTARSLLATFGRMIPGGQRTLKLLGLDKAFDDIAAQAVPALRKLSEGVSEFLRDVVGLGEKAASKKVSEGVAGKAKPDVTPPPSERSSARPGGKDDWDVWGPKKSVDKRVAEEVVPKGGAKAAPGEGKPSGGFLEGMADSVKGAADTVKGGIDYLGGVEALAGPIGIAVVALGALGEAGEIASDGIRGLGRVGAEIVQNNPGAAMRRVADGIINTIDEIPIVGKAFTANIKPFLALADAATALKDAFLANAQKLSQYSGQLSSAEALADVRRMLADIDEAQRTGGRLSRVVELQSKIDVEFQDAMVPLKNDLLEVLVPIMEAALVIAKEIHFVSDSAHAVYQVDKSIVEFLLGPQYQLLKAGWEWVKQKFGIDEDKGDNRLFEQWLSINPDAESGVNPAPPAGFGGAPG